MSILKRDIIKCVRCPAQGGAGVPVYQCEGSQVFQIDPCPYYQNQNPDPSEAVLYCAYDPTRVDGAKIPTDPQTKRPYPGRRDSAFLPVERRPKVEHMFSLQVPPHEALPAEWQTAQRHPLRFLKQS